MSDKTPNQKPILLQDIWQLDDITAYKVHFARYNGDANPLDVWVRNPDHWQHWQEYKPGKDDFNRPYIFALMDFYPEADVWLFGGIFRVLGSTPDSYKVELTGQHQNFIGRLKIFHKPQPREIRVNLENNFPEFQLHEILSKPYSGEN